MAVDVALSWNLSTTDPSKVDGQRVYRSTASSPSFPTDYTEIADVSDSTTSYTDTNQNNNTTYSYAVTAYNSAGESSPTTDSVTTPLPVTLNGQGVANIQINGQDVTGIEINGNQIF
jgi:uncharacterized protein YxeA